MKHGAQFNILTRVIGESRKQYFHNYIATSSNKVKSAWKVKNKPSVNFPSQKKSNINCNDKLLNNATDIANAFNKFCTQIATKLNVRE
jgi:hypothetical protein